MVVFSFRPWVEHIGPLCSSSAMVGVFSVLFLFLASPPISGVNGQESSITFSISTPGAIALNTTTLQNLTIWNDFPVFLSDTVYYSVTTFLNSVGSGSTGTTPSPSDRRGDVGTSSTPAPPSSSGGDGKMEWWHIFLIALGSTVGVIALILAIYFGVIANTRVGPARGGGGGWGQMENGGNGPAAVLVYPPPHAYSKVIQVPIFPSAHNSRPPPLPLLQMVSPRK